MLMMGDIIIIIIRSIYKYDGSYNISACQFIYTTGDIIYLPVNL